MSAIIILCSQICHNHVKTTHYTELNFAQIVPYHNMDTWKSYITWTSMRCVCKKIPLFVCRQINLNEDDEENDEMSLLPFNFQFYSIEAFFLELK